MPSTSIMAGGYVRPLLLLIVAATFAGTAGLWAYYGTAVFFEIVRAGWVACF